MESDQSASRAARRFLEDRVRKDWEWPDVPGKWSASDEEVRDAMSFRERYYGTSSPSASDDDDDGDGDVRDPYKFDCPDSIGGMVERRSERKRRRRRAELEEEMKTNEGLKIFLERRDKWTGADSVRKFGPGRRKGEGEKMGVTDEEATVIADGEKASPAASVEASSSEASTPTDTDDQSPTELLNDSSTLPQSTLTSEPLIPVAPRLLTNNNIRNSITPKTYPDIYSKIVLQSRKPSVPINLSDMTNALVQGWKDNGEWPPRAAHLDPLAGKKRALAGIGLIKGVSGVAGEPFLSHHPHLQKGVEGMKRMLHFGGHTHEDGSGMGSPG